MDVTDDLIPCQSPDDISKGFATTNLPAESARGATQSDLNRIRPRFQAPHQLLPQIVGLPAHHELRLGLIDVPQAAIQLVFELPRPPHHEAQEKARVLGLRLDDAVDRLGFVSEEKIRRDADRAVL